TIDGVPTTEMKRSTVRALFGMVLQDTWLFSGTIKENLSYGKTEAKMLEIKAATKAASIDHLIESMKGGYSANINEDSDNISAGEKQLLTIARALIENPPMMILDEATSNVDTRAEAKIQEAFEKLTNGRTSFVIAHRLSTIRNADLILVMRNGNIVEQGNHEQLLKKNGFYAELYNSQFADIE
ncbi:ATP-binding cassette domain-containing protein, partial [Candidatus Saccharibacteria bacterium]|nr:ATP-binding cassette domain-containing protein [Candidatus Saccharibacteria bacterium]